MRSRRAPASRGYLSMNTVCRQKSIPVLPNPQATDRYHFTGQLVPGHKGKDRYSDSEGSFISENYWILSTASNSFLTHIKNPRTTVLKRLHRLLNCYPQASNVLFIFHLQKRSSDSTEEELSTQNKIKKERKLNLTAKNQKFTPNMDLW